MNQESIIVRCADCGTRNRIPGDRVGERAVCGRCRAPLSVTDRYPDRIVDVSDKTFSREVLSFRGAVAVYFWAAWCGYCQRFTPVVDRLASKYAGRVKFAKIVLDHNPSTASQYAVQSVPTLLLFKGGRKVNSLQGALPQEEVEGHLRSLL